MKMRILLAGDDVSRNLENATHNVLILGSLSDMTPPRTRFVLSQSVPGGSTRLRRPRLSQSLAFCGRHALGSLFGSGKLHWPTANTLQNETVCAKPPRVF